MIKSFANESTRLFFTNGKAFAQWQNFVKIAIRKLDMLDAAVRVADLKFPPGNHLERLKGNRAGQHSIRINDQWRICFIWTNAGPTNMEIVDYY